MSGESRLYLGTDKIFFHSFIDILATYCELLVEIICHWFFNCWKYIWKLENFKVFFISLFYSFSTVQRFDVNVVAEKDRVEKRIFFKNAPQPDMVSYTQELRYQELEGCEKMVIYLAVSIHRYRNLRTIGQYSFLKSLASF